jgi:hypothetical protein
VTDQKSISSFPNLLKENTLFAQDPRNVGNANHLLIASCHPEAGSIWGLAYVEPLITPASVPHIPKQEDVNRSYNLSSPTVFSCSCPEANTIGTPSISALCRLMQEIQLYLIRLLSITSFHQ